MAEKDVGLCPNCKEATWPVYNGKNCSLPNGGCGWPDKAQMELRKRIDECNPPPPPAYDERTERINSFLPSYEERLRRFGF